MTHLFFQSFFMTSFYEKIKKQKCKSGAGHTDLEIDLQI